MRWWALCLLMAVSVRRAWCAAGSRDARVLEARAGGTNRGNPAQVEWFPSQHRLQERMGVQRGVEGEALGVAGGAAGSSAGTRCWIDGGARATRDCPRGAPAVDSTQRRLYGWDGRTDDGWARLKAAGSNLLALRGM